MADGYAGIGDADLGLRRLLGNVGQLFGLRAKLQDRLIAPFPVTEESLDLFAERFPVDVAGHREDRAPRPKQALIVLLDRLGR